MMWKIMSDYTTNNKCACSWCGRSCLTIRQRSFCKWTRFQFRHELSTLLKLNRFSLYIIIQLLISLRAVPDSKGSRLAIINMLHGDAAQLIFFSQFLIILCDIQIFQVLKTKNNYPWPCVYYIRSSEMPKVSILPKLPGKYRD